MSTPMHWARWGDPAAAAPLSETTRGLVEAAFGLTEQDVAPLEQVRVPDASLDEETLAPLRGLVGDEHVLTDHEARVRHTRGKSTADLLRLRGGDGADAPDAVVLPADHDEVLAVLRWATEAGVAVVPFGGGTSVVGGLTARRDGYAGVVALDLRRLDALHRVDHESGTAVLGAGLLGPEAEELLGREGLTLGHFPQSFEYASIGGFAATRSAGQASSGFGRFDALVLGVTVATPVGTLEVGSAPASAAGPDLRQLVLGSEGAFGVITAVHVRVRRAASVRVYDGWRFGSFEGGVAAVRALHQSGLAPTVLRLSDEAETALNLADPTAVGASGADGGCLLVAGFEGSPGEVTDRRTRVSRLLTAEGGEALGEEPGRRWSEGRFHGPYLRDSLLDVGVLVETLETAAFWSNLRRVHADVRAALEGALDSAIVLGHVSHAYENGASLYFTVAARQDGDGLAQWAAAKAAASDAIRAAGATITHHHAVGRDHLPWFADEIGPVGVAMLRGVKQSVDPAGILSPGVLIP